MKKYNVLIIGAGNIGAFYDKPSDKAVLTHAHAFTKHNGFRLLGFVDSDKKKAMAAVRVWGGKTFTSIKGAFSESEPHVVVVSVPDQQHYKVLKELSAYKPKLVIIEKPITTEISHAKKIISIYKAKRIGILVNYTRRFDPVIERTALNIRLGRYGRYITGAAYYGKGILHNGSHIIDLIRYFFSGIRGFIVNGTIHDFIKTDPSVSAMINLDNGGSFYLNAVDSRVYSLFEMDLFFEKKRIRFIDSAFKVENYAIKENSLFKGYKILGKKVIRPTKSSKSMYFLACNVYKHLSVGEKIKCTARDAYKVLLICKKVLKKAK